MAESDRATVDVDSLCGHAKVARGGEAHPGEGLVDLDKVQVADTQGAVAAQRVADRVGRLEQQRRVRAGDGAVGAKLGEPFKP